MTSVPAGAVISLALIKSVVGKMTKAQVANANKGTGAGRILDECIAAGGVYDFGRQRCRDIPAGDR